MSIFDLKYPFLFLVLISVNSLGNCISASPIPTETQNSDSITNSIPQRISNLQNDHERLDTLLEWAKIHRINRAYDKAEFFTQQALILAVALNSKKGQATAYFSKAMNSFQTLKPYSEVSINLLKSLNLFEQIGDSLNMSHCLLQLGLIDYSIGDFNQAVLSFKRCIQLDQNDLDKLATARYLLGLSYSEIGEYRIANELLQSSLKEYALNNPDRELMVRTFIGKLMYNQKRYLESISYLEKAIENFPKHLDTQTISSARAYLCLGYLQIGEIDKAIYNGRYVMDHSEFTSGVLYWVEASKGLHKALAAKGEMEKAYKVLNDLVTLVDSVSGAKVMEQLTNQKAKYAFEKEMLSEKAKQDIEHQIQLRKEHQKRDIWLGSSILALLLAIGFFSRMHNERKAKNKIKIEKDRSEKLLLNILPEKIANELKQNGKAETRMFEDASVLFTDFSEFTKLTEKVDASKLVEEMNHCFRAFDKICDKFKIEKIKTIGDSYMVAGGLPNPSKDSTKNTVLAGIEMARFISNRKSILESKGEEGFEMRTGISTGNVVAGIIGDKKFQYDIWGDTVNTASRMESNGEVGKVNISQATYDLLKDDPEFIFESRGKIAAKGKGELEMYFVCRRNS